MCTNSIVVGIGVVAMNNYNFDCVMLLLLVGGGDILPWVKCPPYLSYSLLMVNIIFAQKLSFVEPHPSSA